METNTKELIATVRAELEQFHGCVFVIDRALAADLCDRLERAESACREQSTILETAEARAEHVVKLIARAEAAEAALKRAEQRIAQLEGEP